MEFFVEQKFIFDLSFFEWRKVLFSLSNLCGWRFMDAAGLLLPI